MSNSPSKPTKGVRHLRPCIPLRFSAKQAEVVLTDVCPHRRKFTSCQRYFCTVAHEKYQWLELVREKSKQTQEIVEEADQLLRNKLFYTYNCSIENLLATQELELESLRKQLSRKSAKHKIIDENLRYVKFYELDKKDPLEAECPLGYTKDHVDFIMHQSDVLKERQHVSMKTALDLKKYEQSQELAKLKQSIDSPVSHLDHLLKQHFETIQFHTGRVEKLILYILNLCVVPRSYSPDPPDVDDPLLVSRVKKTSSQAFQLLKTTLDALAKLCADIRKIYCNAEEEVLALLPHSFGSTEGADPSSFSLLPLKPVGESNYNCDGEEVQEQVEDVEPKVSSKNASDKQPEITYPKKSPETPHVTNEPRTGNPKSSLKKSRKKLLGENKLIARMSDTKLNDVALLNAIISRSKEVPNGDDTHLYDQGQTEGLQDSSMPFNPHPCCFCRKKFRGTGKISPSIMNRDADTRSRAKLTVQGDVVPQFTTKKIDRFKERKQSLMTDLEKSADQSSNSSSVFCSWVCVKRWTVMCCPMQYKYQSEMLIDMVAGYSVKI